MHGETPEEAAARVAQGLLSDILEPGCTLSPPHDLLPNRCVRLAGAWLVFRRLDDNGGMVVARPGTQDEWIHTPEPGELVLTAEPW